MNHSRTSYIRVLYNKTQVLGEADFGKNDPSPFSAILNGRKLEKVLK
jgi:hypothetical protein